MRKRKKTTPNSRNGKSRKTITSEYGEQEIAVPRDRQGEFEPLVVKKYPSNVTGIEDQIIALYAKGVSTHKQRSEVHHSPDSQFDALRGDCKIVCVNSQT